MNNEQKIQIKATDDKLKGVYSNLMQVSHTKEEFILDFFLVFPPSGVLNSRIIMNPGHLKRVIKALQENMNKYEEKFGEIKEAQSPETKIGFST